VREALATYEESKDLIELGAYSAGSQPKLDVAIRMRPQLNDFLRQDIHEGPAFAESSAKMASLAACL
jgi:flagellar biosynthesis/type III secretory pathway ATPase